MTSLKNSSKVNQGAPKLWQKNELVILAVIPVALTAVLGQWLYVFSLKYAWFPAYFASFTFFALLLLPLVALVWNSNIRFLVRDDVVRKVVLSITLLASSTLIASFIAYLRYSNSYYFTDGLKAVVAFFSSILLISFIGERVNVAMKCVYLIYFLLLFFGLSQLILRVNFATKESLLTLGVSGRWWDFNALWGPMALTGKNAYGVSIVLCLCILVPLLSSNFLQRQSYILLASSMPLALICLYYSKSRIAILCALFLFVTEVASQAKRKNDLRYVFLISYGFVLMLTVLWVKTGFDFLELWVFDSRSITARGQALSATFSSPENNFVWGAGYFGIFEITASTFGDSISTANQSLGLNVDNFFVRRLIETGFLGTFPFLLFLWTLIQKKTSLDISRPLHQREIWLRSMSYLGFVMIFTSLTGDYLSNLNIIAITSFVLSAICVGLNHTMEPK